MAAGGFVRERTSAAGVWRRAGGFDGAVAPAPAECPPVGYKLRDAYRDVWVRFHSLPESKRYAEDESEYTVVLERYNTVLAELFAGTNVYVITPLWTTEAELLRDIADDIRMQRIHHPYDGGADVFLATSEERDRMRDRHADWLSRHPSGL
jgi:hypothetical protein